VYLSRSQRVSANVVRHAWRFAMRHTRFHAMPCDAVPCCVTADGSVGSIWMSDFLPSQMATYACTHRCVRNMYVSTHHPPPTNQRPPSPHRHHTDFDSRKKKGRKSKEKCLQPKLPCSHAQPRASPLRIRWFAAIRGPAFAAQASHSLAG